jgi:Xaa-Pro aminopeptidase
MFQSFDNPSSPETGGPRLAALRTVLKRKGLAGFIIPRADAHQGEYVAASDMRLAWLTGFTGSAGFCIALQDKAGVFIDGRYSLQVRDQVDLSCFTPVAWPDTQPGDWLAENLAGGVIGFDPWLHTAGEIAKIEKRLAGSGITLRRVDNPVDEIWTDRPAPPRDLMVPYPAELAGKTHGEKRAEIAATLRKQGQKAAVITLPDSIAWLLNTRGTDLGQTPVALAFAILGDDGHVSLFMDPAKADDSLHEHLGNAVSISPPETFAPALQALQGPVLVDSNSAPLWVSDQLNSAGIAIENSRDPVILPKAVKNPAEINGTRAAHLRDGAAMAEFLCWVDGLGDDPQVSEIEVAQKLESIRAATGKLRNISFDTICGAGPNGAIVHYRVNTDSNRQILRGDVLLVDSGAQYLDGTTDITRTMAIGTPPREAIHAFTLVLKGMIAISRQRFPNGLSGRDLDPLARMALWSEGMDYDHGTGHGVGVFLSVHEGPQRISRISGEKLRAGMILSNEPGYYREGAFGIRIENLIVVQPAAPMGDKRDMLEFETLTWAPIDRHMIDINLLTTVERDWLNGYHAQTLAKIAPLCSPDVADWLQRACAPL